MSQSQHSTGLILESRVGNLDEDESHEHEDQWEDELRDDGHVETKRVVEPLEKHGPELLEPEDRASVSHYRGCLRETMDGVHTLIHAETNCTLVLLRLAENNITTQWLFYTCTLVFYI